MGDFMKDSYIKIIKEHGNTVVLKRDKQEIISAFKEQGLNVTVRDFTTTTFVDADNCYIVELA